jgi:FkbM family methyltransferase
VNGKEVYMKYLSSIRNRDSVTVTIYGSRMHLYPDRDGIDQSLLWKGETREYLSTKEYKSILTTLQRRPEDVLILDIGSNIGYFALLAAQTTPNAEIVAFEANTRNFQRLTRHIKHNTGAIQAINKAVGKSMGVKELVVDTKSTLHHIVDATNQQGHSETEVVELVAIDEYLNRRSRSNSCTYVIRMDIQGYEYKALYGMRELLSSSASIFLFVELHLNDLNTNTYNDLIDMLNEKEFDVHLVCRNAGVRSVDIDSFDTLRDIDFDVHLQATKNLHL